MRFRTAPVVRRPAPSDAPIRAALAFHVQTCYNALITPGQPPIARAAAAAMVRERRRAAGIAADRENTTKEETVKKFVTALMTVAILAMGLSLTGCKKEAEPTAEGPPRPPLSRELEEGAKKAAEAGAEAQEEVKEAVEEAAAEAK